MKLYKLKDRMFLIAAMLLGGVTAALSAFVSILLQQIIDVAVGGNMTDFARLFLVMVIYLAVLGIMGFLEALLGKRLLRNTSIHLRNELFSGIMQKSPVDFSAENSADYLSAIINDVKLLEENFLLPLLMSSQMAVLFVTTLGILFFLSPVVTCVLLVSLVLMFLVPALLGKSMQKKQDAYSEQLSEFTACTKDSLSGYEVVYDYHVFPHIFHKFKRSNKYTADKKYAADRLLAVNESFSDVFSSLSVVVIVFVSAWLLMKGEITMGTLLALIQLSGTFITPVIMVMQNVPKITGMKPIIERLHSLKQDNADNEVSDIASGRKNHPALPEGREKAFRELSLKDLSFSYELGRPILDHAEFSAEAGKKYALLGESGCGKSTLIRLLTGHMQEFEGSVFYNDRSISEYSRTDLARMTAVIHQNVFLFDTDIYDNICLGEEFTKEEINQAVEESGIAQFLPSLEKGLHTQVGENGQLLSGGQRQRIAIARALIRRTPVLFVDEGTSAVDRETAYEIEKTLLQNKKLTIIVITHHMNEELEKLYNQVLTLQDGKIRAYTG